MSDKVRETYPDRVPVIAEPDSSSTYTVTNRKYLVPKEAYVAYFHREIRKNIIEFNPQESTFLFLENGTLPIGSITIGQLDSMYCDRDGFLYLKFTGENVFG